MINVTRTDLPDLERYIEYLKGIWSANWVTNDGDLVRLLESRLAEYLGTGPIAAVSTGTAALQLAMKALGVDGEVITTPFTFAATTNSIIWEGLTPVFADIDPATLCLDPECVEKKLSRKTGAILAVHAFGNPCNVRELESLASSHGVALIFDAAHAFGVQVSGRPVIDFGDASCLSFHATKVFSTIEGGAVRAGGEKIMDRVRTMRNHGIISEEEVVLAGTNSKMNEFEAAMGLCNLEGIDARIEARKSLSDEYRLRLGELEGVSFQSVSASRYNYAYMPILLRDRGVRDAVYTALLERGVHARKYFFPLTSDYSYVQELLRGSARGHDLPVARDISGRVLCLPLFPGLEAGAQQSIIDVVARITSQSR